MAILKEGDSDKAISEVKKVLKKIKKGDVDKKEPLTARGHSPGSQG